MFGPEEVERTVGAAKQREQAEGNGNEPQSKKRNWAHDSHCKKTD